MIVYRDIIDFSVLTVYPTVLLNVLTIVMSFIFEDFLGLCFLNAVICEYRSFTSSSPPIDCFVFLFPAL